MENLDLRIQKTYKLLIDAFEDLLKEKEFEEISVTELCDAAMIRRPTFYSHFLDKYDFLTFFIKHRMNQIFETVFEKLDQKEELKEYDFFILVFEQLLKQFDNLLFLIFSLQMSSDITVELEGIQKYGQKMLRNRVNTQSSNHQTIMANKYKGQMIMGITIQSVYWYKNNQDEMSQKEITKLYKKTLENLW